MFAHLFVDDCLEINVASKNKGFIKMPAKTAFFPPERDKCRTLLSQKNAFRKAAGNRPSEGDTE
jgi:hypothetical protein